MSITKNLNHSNASAVFVSCPHKYVVQDNAITVGQDEEKELPSIAPLLLLGLLNKNDLKCDFLDWASYSDNTIDKVASIASKYEVVFLSSNSINWGIVRLLAKKIKLHKYTCKICIGGPHASLYYNEISKENLFEYIVVGEADLIFCDLFRRITGLKSKNKNWRNNSNVIFSPSIEKLDILDNKIAYDLIPSDLYESLPVETSRGCKFACSFCSVLSHNNWRGYSVENSIDQLKTADTYKTLKNCNTIQIIDNSFTSNNARAIKICSKLPQSTFENILSYDATIQDLQNIELIEAISHFTKHILTGAEVSTNTSAKRIRKPVTRKSIKNAAKNLAQFNINHKAVFSFIIGFPWQSKKDCLQTIEFASGLILEHGISVLIQWYWPIPGSKIWRELEESSDINIGMIDSPTPQKTLELFYQSSPLDKKDIIAIEDKISPINLCLMLNSKHFGRPKLKLTNSPLKLQDLLNI